MADSTLAATIGTEYARMLHGIVPQIEAAFSRGVKKSSFTVTVDFRRMAGGEVDAVMSQKASIPMQPAQFKLSYHSGQLNLFEGSPSESQTTES